MDLFFAGVLLLVAWPLYNLVLVLYSARDSTPGRRRRKLATPNGNEPHTFWIVVPALNEERVVANTVRAALDLSGPQGTRTEVVVVDDGSDDGTPQALAAIKHPNLHVLRRVPPHARRGKGEALNAAYRYIRAQTQAAGEDPARVAVGVIDGDGRGSPNMLQEVSWAMRDPQVGAVQSRVRIHNRNKILGAVQDLEFACVANASQLLRNSLGTVGLGGNGQFARLSALMELGEEPWSKCLVEDLELGLRMHLKGLRIRYLSRAFVTQQGVVDVKRLLRQRTRWAQGNLQCARYAPKLIASRRIRNGALMEMLYYLFAPWLNAFGMVAMLGTWLFAVWRLLPGNGPAWLVTSWGQLGSTVVVWLAAMVAPSLVWAVMHRFVLRDETFGRILLASIAYPAFLFLGMAATWRAIGRHLTGRSAWAKTERLVEEAIPSAAPARHAQPVGA